MNFAVLQQAMEGRGRKALHFNASTYLKETSDKFDWVDNHFTERDDSIIDVAESMYQDCAFDEIDIPMEVVDMLGPGD